MEKPYHHGHLKNELLEAGVELLNREGEDHFSLRKLAALCGVSHAAPYSHFRNKDDLLREMQTYVTARFMQALEEPVRSGLYPDETEQLVQIGKAYVLFFHRHPQYFPFLFSQPCIRIDLSGDGGENDYPPYRFFREKALVALRKTGCPEQKIQDAVLSMWALVHGFSSIATMEHVRYDRNWEDTIESLLRPAKG